MKKFMSIFLMLIIISWIPSSASITDTLTCYNNEELKKIAIKVVHANECDTILNTTMLQLQNTETQLSNMNQVSQRKDTIINNLQQIVTGYRCINQQQKNTIQKLKTKLVVTNVTWGLVALICLFLL